MSVIIPAFNSECYIGYAIDSVLKQTYHNFEIIVVDDGSMDQTAEIVENFRNENIRYIFQTNRGLSSARNSGIQLARGDYLVFLDSDDTLLPEKLAIEVEFLEDNDDVGIIVNGFEYIDSESRVIKIENNLPTLQSFQELTLEDVFWRGIGGPPHSAMLRNGLVHIVGGFDDKLRAWEDMDFWYRTALAGCKLVKTNNIVCQYRIHGQNMTSRIDDHMFWCLEYLDKIFNNPQTPQYIKNQRGSRFSSEYLRFAGRYFASGMIERGEEAIATALLYEPELNDNQNTKIAREFTSIATSIWVRDREAYIGLITNSLVRKYKTGRKWAKQIKVYLLKQLFYSFYYHKQFNKIFSLWLHIFSCQPSWIFNRGGISILLQSMDIIPPK